MLMINLNFITAKNHYLYNCHYIAYSANELSSCIVETIHRIVQLAITLTFAPTFSVPILIVGYSVNPLITYFSTKIKILPLNPIANRLKPMNRTILACHCRGLIPESKPPPFAFTSCTLSREFTTIIPSVEQINGTQSTNPTWTIDAFIVLLKIEASIISHNPIEYSTPDTYIVTDRSEWWFIWNGKENLNSLLSSDIVAVCLLGQRLP